MKDDYPLVSVIIPTYNRKDFLKIAVKSALKQTYENLEIIVVNDNPDVSHEKVMNTLDDRRITYIEHEQNRGGAAARNTGIKNSQGGYIAFLDDDDIWLPEKIEKQVKCIESQNGDYVGAYCGYFGIYQFLGFDKIKRIFAKNMDADEIIIDIFTQDFHPGGTSSLIIKRKYIENIGGFDESFERHQDYEFLIRLLKHGGIIPVKEPLLIKYYTSPPKAEKVENAKIRFFSKFKEDIQKYETSLRSEILNVHLSELSSLYLRETKFRKGFHYLKKQKGSWPLKSLLKAFYFWIEDFLNYWKNWLEDN